MSTTIGNLAVMLSANASKFTAGMSRASSSTRKFRTAANQNIASVGGAMSALGNAAKRLGPLIVGALGTRAMFQQLDRLDQMGKTASLLGTTAEELSRLQFAGEQTGVGISTMNMALQRMTRRVAEAAAGTGEAKNAIAELGLDAVALNAMGPAKAFAVLADAIKKVKNPSDRVRLAMKLFDSEGVKLVNTMKLGSDGLAEMAKKSDALGNTVSGKAARSAAAFNDTINEMKVALGGVAAELATAIIPLLKALAKAVTFAIKGINSLVDGIKGLFAGELPGGWKVVDNVERLGESAKNASTWVSDLKTKIVEFAKSLPATEEKAKTLSDRIMEMFSGQTVTGFEPVTNAIVSQFDKIKASIEDAKSRAASIFDATRTPAERFAAKLKEIKELASTGFLDADTARRAIEQLNQQKAGQAAAVPDPQLAANRVNFAAMGAEAAAGRGQDKLEKNTAEEVKESKKQNASLAELLRIGRNSQGAQITVAF